MSPSGIVVNMLDSDIEVSDFELQSHYYVPFQTNCVSYELLYPPSYELNCTTIVFL